MTMPTLVVFKGLDRDVLIEGPGATSFDFDDYSSAEFRVPALSITKSTTNAAQAELANSGADLLVHLTDADFTNATPGQYPYQVVLLTSGGLEIDLADVGVFDVREAVA